MARLLLVEDDEAIAGPLARALRRNGHDVDAVGDGESALEELAGDGAAVDLVVLDVGLPGIDGVTTCRRMRADRPGLPVLMLTARAGELDEVAGLEAGADDYVTKPFKLAVLQARIDALLRRGALDPRVDRDVVEAEGVRVERGARRAWRDGRELALTPKEFDLLAQLVANAGQAMRREALMAAVWNVEWFGSTKTLDVHVAALRRKLGDPSPIATVRGVGFRFEPG